MAFGIVTLLELALAVLVGTILVQNRRRPEWKPALFSWALFAMMVVVVVGMEITSRYLDPLDSVMKKMDEAGFAVLATATASVLVNLVACALIVVRTPERSSVALLVATLVFTALAALILSAATTPAGLAG